MGRVAFALVCALVLMLAGTPPAALAAWSAAPIWTTAATACGTPGVPTTTIFLPNVTKTLGGPSGWVTPFIVQNVGVKKTTLEVSFFSFNSGALVTCRKIAGLAPATSFADFPNADEDLPADTQFSVVVRSFGSQVVSVVNQHQGLGTPARAEALAYSGLTTGATSVYLPFVGKPASGPCPVAPAINTTCDRPWLTTFVMQNFGAVGTTVSAQFTGHDGATGPTLTRVIAPGRSRSIDPMAEPALQAGRLYSVVLTSAQPIGVIANAHDDAPSSAAPRGFSYNGVPQPATDEVFLPSVRRDGVARASPNGVMVQNAGLFEARPTLLLYSSGTARPLTITAPAAIRPGATWVFDPEGSALGIGDHSLVVTGGAFAVLGATLVPGAATGYVGAGRSGNRAYLPNVTRTLGGARGWTTPIIVQSAGATSVTLRWYRFADGALVTRQTSPLPGRGGAVRIDPRTVPGLADGTQYGVVADAQGGDIVTLVAELNFEGGDGTMSYEGFPATVDTVPAATAITLGPGVVQLGTDETAQLTAVVRDQFDEVMPLAVPTWQVAPVALGTVGERAVLTAGSAGGVGAITATAGAASETIQLTVVAPTVVTKGGISFLLRTTGSTDLYAESTVSRSVAAAINAQVNSDLARIQVDYGRTFAARPEVYLLANDPTYTTAQTQILGIDAMFLSSPSLADELQSSGVYYRKRIAVNLARVSGQLPFTTARHELTHMMIDEITADAAVPAWLNEGLARLEEFTVPGAQWWQMVERYRAASMALNGLQLSIGELTSQYAWNAREGALGSYQYAEASQIVELLRADIGFPGQLQILTVMAAGHSFEDAYTAVTGRPWADFAASVPARLRAIAPGPGIAFAPDSPAGPGAEGPSFVIYGYGPSAVVTLSIRGTTTGLANTGRSQIVDGFGVYWSRLGPAWPPDTYTFTVTSSGAPTITKTVTKLP